MTTTELLPLFKAKVDEIGQAEVSRRIGKSSSAICQLYHGTYPADPAGLLRRFEEEFCGTTVVCPVMGEITLKRCSDERTTPFSASSPRRIRMHQACKECGGKP
jgi:hypothetical protein